MKKYRCKHCQKVVFEFEKEKHRKTCASKAANNPVDFLSKLFGMGKK